MYLFKLLENNFDTLNLRIKIELFLLPVLTIALIWTLFFDKKSNNQEKIYSLQIQNIQMNDSYLDIIKSIETYAKKNSILIDYIQNENKIVKFSANSSLEKQIQLINFIENYNSFSNISFIKKNKNNLYLEVSFDKLYEKSKNNSIKKLSFSLPKVKKYTLHAIIGKKVFINKKWISLNEFIGSYKLVKISFNFIILSNGYKSITLRLYKNE